MTRRARLLAAAAAAALLTAGAAAHDAIRGLAGKPILWKTSAVAFTPNPAGSDGVADDSELLAIRLAFAEWNAALDGKLTFVESTANAESLDVDDFKTHRVVFDEDDSTGYFPTGAGVVALTPIRHTADNKILDADIVFNGRDHAFSTSLTPGAFDVRDVAAHEVGHFAGLDHSPFLCATLFPYVKHAQTAHRALADDDRAGARRLYGAALDSTGSLTGAVHLEKPGGAPGKALAGAHVSARRPDGRAVTGTLTKADGTFELAALEPGPYVVSVSPLDGPLTPASLASDLPVEVGFGSSVVGTVAGPLAWTVSAGTSTSIGLAIVPAAPSPSLQTFLTIEPLTVPAGGSAFFDAYGSGFGPDAAAAVPGGIVAVTGFVKHTGGTGGSGILSAPPGSEAAAYDLLLDDGQGGIAVEPGAVEVAPPSPFVMSLTPASGPLSGGAELEIHGSYLAPGALVVVGDRLAAPVSWSAGVLRAVAPGFDDAPSNPLDVVVVNPDGQEARKAGAYQPLADLAAASVFPAAASAAGGAAIHVQGSGFVPGTTARLVKSGGAGPEIPLDASPSGPYQLSAVLPPLAEGAYDVKIALPPGAPHEGPAEVVLTGALEAVAAPDPTIHQVLPGVAPTSGGTGVRLLGSGFTSQTKVRLGVNPLTGEGGADVDSVVVVSPHEIQWTAPPSAAEGTVTLLLTTELGQASPPAEFEYIAASAASGSSSSGGGGGPGCGAAFIAGAEPPSPSDQAGALVSSSLALVVAAALALRRRRLAAVPALSRR